MLHGELSYMLPVCMTHMEGGRNNLQQLEIVSLVWLYKWPQYTQKVKLAKVVVGLNIAQNHSSRSKEVSGHYLSWLLWTVEQILYKVNKRPLGLRALLSNNTWSMIHSPMKLNEHPMTLIWPFNTTKGKCHGVNWKIIYDLLYKHFIQNLIRCSI